MNKTFKSQQAQEEAFTDSSNLQAAEAQLCEGGRGWRGGGRLYHDQTFF